jgi:hypothetical protein
MQKPFTINTGRRTKLVLGQQWWLEICYFSSDVGFFGRMGGLFASNLQEEAKGYV